VRFRDFAPITRCQNRHVTWFEACRVAAERYGFMGSSMMPSKRKVFSILKDPHLGQEYSYRFPGFSKARSFFASWRPQILHSPT
jgi:hypothetical protein